MFAYPEEDYPGMGQPITNDQLAEVTVVGDEDGSLRPCQSEHFVVR
jgi:hypothetical protein